ncbi:hypothetical protein HK096_001298, partial [Nowakowskiella sp. JEL0078]
MSKNARVTLGITYTIPSTDNPRLKKNMMTLFSINGNVLFNYTKTNLVFIAESHNFEPGSGKVPVVNISIPITTGRRQRKFVDLSVSGVICHDLDYPGFMSKVSRASLILAPAKTWSSKSGRSHFEITRMRAVEQGVTVLRCDSGGVSGIIDPLGQARFWEHTSSAAINS